MKSIAIPSVILALTLTLTVTAASAETERADLTESSDSAKVPKLSVTTSPLLLAFGVLELTGEYALTNKTSVAAIVGAGSIFGVEVFEAGGQVRHYVVGSFRHGLGFGIEVGASTVLVDANGDIDSAAGYSAAPFLAYKYVAGFGLTVDLNAGIAYRRVTDDESAESDVGLMLNLNLGWTF